MVYEYLTNSLLWSVLFLLIGFFGASLYCNLRGFPGHHHHEGHHRDRDHPDRRYHR